MNFPTRVLFSCVLLMLIAGLQWSLWMGKGSYFEVQKLQKSISDQRETNKALNARNLALTAEVKDLANGTAAIEELARSELGFIKRDEIFFQVNDPVANFNETKK
ncbi:MAG: cell division protein FtsB [Neisseriaceae bacterium]|nr:cell division protein FtsB [Neisseriaceae bacterium]